MTVYLVLGHPTSIFSPSIVHAIIYLHTATGDILLYSFTERQFFCTILSGHKCIPFWRLLITHNRVPSVRTLTAWNGMYHDGDIMNPYTSECFVRRNLLRELDGMSKRPYLFKCNQRDLIYSRTWASFQRQRRKWKANALLRNVYTGDFCRV